MENFSEIKFANPYLSLQLTATEDSSVYASGTFENVQWFHGRHGEMVVCVGGGWEELTGGKRFENHHLKSLIWAGHHIMMKMYSNIECICGTFANIK